MGDLEGVQEAVQDLEVVQEAVQDLEVVQEAVQDLDLAVVQDLEVVQDLDLEAVQDLDLDLEVVQEAVLEVVQEVVQLLDSNICISLFNYHLDSNQNLKYVNSSLKFNTVLIWPIIQSRKILFLMKN